MHPARLNSLLSYFYVSDKIDIYRQDRVSREKVMMQKKRKARTMASIATPIKTASVTSGSSS